MAVTAIAADETIERRIDATTGELDEYIELIIETGNANTLY